MSENRLNRFAQCGSALYTQVEVHEGTARLTCNSCRDRFCTPCGNARARIITSALDSVMKGKTTRFVTLTQRASDTPLADQIDRLYRNFSVLRRRTWWRDHAEGGAAFLEVKLGQNSGLWHPHLHIILQGTYLPQAELSAEWHAVTGDSFIVHVGDCRDSTARARYVTKYVTKPATSEVFQDAAKLAEMLQAMKGRRLCLTFGSWRGTPLDPDEAPAGEWKHAGTLEQVMHRAVSGCLVSLGILQQLAARYPTFPAVVDFFDRRRRPPPPE